MPEIPKSYECRIVSDILEPSTLRSTLVIPESVGGLAVFEGLIRNHNHGKVVTKLEYECYEPLALKEMGRIAIEAREQFGLNYSYQIHRIGLLAVGDIAVFIAALAKHRDEAFQGCRYIIDQLKIRVPIWKKEFYQDESYSWTRCHEHTRRTYD